jgi:hypothetical protein
MTESEKDTGGHVDAPQQADAGPDRRRFLQGALSVAAGLGVAGVAGVAAPRTAAAGPRPRWPGSTSTRTTCCPTTARR